MRRLIALLLRFCRSEATIEARNPAPLPELPDYRRPPRLVPPVVRAPRVDEPISSSLGRLTFDPSRPHTVAADGLLVQRAAVDVLLADGRMSRLGILAAFDARTHEPRRMSYIPLHELTESQEVPG